MWDFCIRTFARYCWEGSWRGVDLDENFSATLLPSHGAASDASRLFSLQPELVCNTASGLTSRIKSAAVIEITVYDEQHNVVWGDVRLCEFQSRRSEESFAQSEGVDFENVHRATLNDSILCAELKSSIGSVLCKLCQVSPFHSSLSADVLERAGSGDTAGDVPDFIFAVQSLSLSINPAWRDAWFPRGD